MSKNAERAYREHISDDPSCLTDAFDFALPPSDTANEPGTKLVRGLCFEEARYEDNTRPAFSEQFPYMLDHGVRQVSLALDVLTDPEIRDRLPGWFDLKLFSQAALVADVGLAFVPHQEVEAVHEFGPRLAQDYTKHPRYGYGMAQAIGVTDPASETIASFIARHHNIQARNQYGVGWNDISQRHINPERVDLLVALQKPFDFFDDSIDRHTDGATAFDTRVGRLIDRFSRSSGMLLCANLALVASMDKNGFDPALPNQIAAKIEEIVLGKTAIGAVYRELRPDLEFAPAA